MYGEELQPIDIESLAMVGAVQSYRVVECESSFGKGLRVEVYTVDKHKYTTPCLPREIASKTVLVVALYSKGKFSKIVMRGITTEPRSHEEDTRR